MRKKRNPAVYLLFFIFLLFIAGISFINYRTYQKMFSVEREMTQISEALKLQQEKLHQMETVLSREDIYSTTEVPVFSGTDTPDTPAPEQAFESDSPVPAAENDHHPEPPPGETSY